MTFGEKLQSLRKQHGLSQEQFAEQLDVTRQAISKWELGATLPDTDNVIQISKIFNVSIDYLLLEKLENIASSISETENLIVPQKTQISIIGIVLAVFSSAFGFIGMLTMGILSSINAVYITYPMEVGSEDTNFVRTGLPAYLEVHNIEWLFVLCAIMALVGLIIFLYPPISVKWRKHIKRLRKR